MRIGLDFDNTLAGYDRVFASAARAAGIVDQGFAGSKVAVRAACRALPDGETAWMRLQGRVYGAHMAEAELIAGVAGFLGRAKRLGATLFVVSHKTMHGHFDPDRIDLREAARGWMHSQGFFAADGFGLDPAAVFFEPTRADKVAHIASLDLDHFVDDLEEVFLEPGFPPGVARHLYTNGEAAPDGPFLPFRHWDELTARLFP